jgi:hypothetical protein
MWGDLNQKIAFNGESNREHLSEQGAPEIVNWRELGAADPVMDQG